MTIPRLSQPPGKPDESYVLPFLGGELWTIPTSNSIMRMVVTGEESKGEFAVVTTGGQEDNPIGFHFHKEAHDVFLCLKGSMNVWADDQARTLYPGDFASVPPNSVHQYQILGSHTEFCGLIVPGGWEEFFRFIGEPYSLTSEHGPLFPTKDRRNPMEVLVPKLIAATEKFDMIPKRDHKGADPTPCSKADSTLPESTAPFFLKADAGPRYAAGGFLVKPLARPSNTNGKFAIARIEASKAVEAKLFEGRTLKFATAHHAFLIDAGSFKFTVAGETSTVQNGETVFVPAGVEFAFEGESSYGALYAFTNGGGLVEVLIGAGEKYDSQIIAEDFPVAIAKDEELKKLEKGCGFEIQQLESKLNGVHV